MKRIAVLGSSGAGKTTLARALGERLGLEVIHLDALFWQPGWVETPRPTWADLQRALVQRPSWIIDGGYNGTLEIRLAAADTVIFLDRSRWLCVWRVIWRRIRYHGRSRADLPPSCPEKLDLAHLRLVWSYPATRRPRMLATLADHAATKTCIHLRSARAVARFLAGLAPGPHIEGGHHG